MSFETPTSLEISAFGLAGFLFLGIALLALLRWLRQLLGQLRVGPSRRAALSGSMAVVEALVTVVFVLSAVPLVFSDHPTYSPIVLSAIILGLVAVSWLAIRDFVDGMLLRAGRVCRVGDHIAIEGHQGRVAHLGYRVLTLVEADGAETLVPYGRIARGPIVRRPETLGAARHAFDLHLPEGLAPSEARDRIRELALGSHWASPTHSPEVSLAASGVARVTVFPLDAEHAAEVEAAVRQGLSDR